MDKEAYEKSVQGQELDETEKMLSRNDTIRRCSYEDKPCSWCGACNDHDYGCS